MLVVDNAPDARELLTIMFEGDAAEMVAVASASEALEVLKRFQPDILLSNIRLPESDGYSLLLKVRNLDVRETDFSDGIGLGGGALTCT